MGFNNLVNLRHQADGFGQCDDDFLVVSDVVLRERAAFAVFQPFLADLIAADVEVPHRLAHTLEADGLRLVHPHGVIRPRWFFDLGIFSADEFGDGMIELGRFQQVQGDKLTTQCCEGLKQRQTTRQRNAREVDFKELNVAGAVCRTMKDGIDVAEDGIGCRRANDGR